MTLYSELFVGFELGLLTWLVAYLVNRSWLAFKDLIT